MEDEPVSAHTRLNVQFVHADQDVECGDVGVAIAGAQLNGAVLVK
jgi:hypothetical protein